MYAFVDRPIALLGPADRFLLDAMRAWVHALTLAGDPGEAVNPGFARRGLSDRFLPFDEAMRALDRGSSDTLTFQRPCHVTVEEDEAVLLSLWRLVREDRIGTALAAARQLVTPAAATRLVRAMAACEAHPG